MLTIVFISAAFALMLRATVPPAAERWRETMRGNLCQIAELQHAYHGEHGTYADSLGLLPFAWSRADHYCFYITSADASSFTVLAIVNSDDDQTFDVWEVDEEGTPTVRIDDLSE